MSRFGLDGVIRRRIGARFPWSTLIVNASGSLLLGMVTGLILFRHDPSDIKLIIGTGFCGGYTTFSAASFESVRLLQEKLYRAAIGNAVGTLVICMGTAALGLAVVRA